MYEEVNGDGVLDEKDYVYLGSDDPKISYSFNLGLEWGPNGIGSQILYQHQIMLHG